MQLWHGFSTVTKLTKTNQNIIIGSKKVDWVRSFRFWPESVVRFGSGPNRCIKCNIGMIFLHSNETDQNEPKHHYWVEKSGLGAFVSFLARIGSSFRFRPECVHKCNFGMVFCTVTKLTKTNQNITIGSKKVDWVRSFRFWPESVVRFGSDPNLYINATFAWFFAQ